VRPLNLASQPFRNERLPRLLLGLGAFVVGLVSLRHALLLADLRPGRTYARHAELARLDAESNRLRGEAEGLKMPRPEAHMVAEWSALKDLVDRRTFSWIRLFGVLEETLNPGLRLQSVGPQVEKGQVTLDLQARARGYDDGVELIRLLEERPEFENVYPTSRGTLDDGTVEFRYLMRYLPSATPPPRPAEAAAGGAVVEDDPEDAAEVPR
jgi:hypothetical protein